MLSFIPPFLLGTFRVKSGLAQMTKGGVVMDVINAEQARIAEEAGVSSSAPYAISLSSSGHSCYIAQQFDPIGLYGRAVQCPCVM